MTTTPTLARPVTCFTPAVSDDLLHLVSVAAARPNVQEAVEANHDNNQWWPTSVADWRTRMVVAGWSARVSYAMVGTYSRTVSRADELGYDYLTAMSETDLFELIQPIGLHTARMEYMRSLAELLATPEGDAETILRRHSDTAIKVVAGKVRYAGYKIAQCAVLYARGYHCGIVPVDSGMLTKLAPCLGWRFSSAAIAHEQMRAVLEACVADKVHDYLALIRNLGYRVTLPADTLPTWWVHLVLIYFKRLYCNAPADRLCVKRPVCDRVLDCECAIWDDE